MGKEYDQYLRDRLYWSETLHRLNHCLRPIQTVVYSIVPWLTHSSGVYVYLNRLFVSVLFICFLSTCSVYTYTVFCFQFLRANFQTVFRIWENFFLCMFFTILLSKFSNRLFVSEKALELCRKLFSLSSAITTINILLFIINITILKNQQQQKHKNQHIF